MTCNGGPSGDDNDPPEVRCEDRTPVTATTFACQWEACSVGKICVENAELGDMLCDEHACAPHAPGVRGHAHL